MTEKESLDQYLERIQNEPDAVRAEFEADMLKRNGQEWFDENQQYFDAWWEQAHQQMIGPIESGGEKAE